MSYFEFWRFYGVLWAGLMWLFLIGFLVERLIHWLRPKEEEEKGDEPTEVEEWHKEEEL